MEEWKYGSINYLARLRWVVSSRLDRLTLREMDQ
jgi:hypothetical protein